MSHTRNSSHRRNIILQSINLATLEYQADSGNGDSTTLAAIEYRCALCSVNCPTKALVIRHLAVTHDMLQQTTKGSKFLYECPTCDKEFSDLSIFKMHLRVHHKRKYNCPNCSKVFDQRDQLDKHCLSQHGDKEPAIYTCEECSRIFTDWRKRWQHSILHKPPQFACNQCDRKLFTASAKVAHIRSAHQRLGVQRARKTTSELSCQHCSMLYANANSLKIHIKDMHQPKEHKCSHCYAEFVTLNELNNHQLNAHSIAVKRDTACEICQKIYKDRRGLAAHMILHGNPTHFCSKCPAKFYNSGTLAGHVKHAHTAKYDMPLRTTSEKINYACAVCCKPFSWKGNLRAHLKIHSSKVQICPVCYQSLNSERRYREHMHQKHPQSRTTHCDICNKNFPTHETYLKHRKYHGKPTFACPDCRLQFYTKGRLTTHSHWHKRKVSRSQNKKISSSMNTFGCALCFTKLSTRWQLKCHLNQHNNLNTKCTYLCSKCDFQGYSKKSITRHLTLFH